MSDIQRVQAAAVEAYEALKATEDAVRWGTADPADLAQAWTTYHAASDEQYFHERGWDVAPVASDVDGAAR